MDINIWITRLLLYKPLITFTKLRIVNNYYWDLIFFEIEVSTIHCIVCNNRYKLSILLHKVTHFSLTILKLNCSNQLKINEYVFILKLHMLSPMYVFIKKNNHWMLSRWFYQVFNVLISITFGEILYFWHCPGIWNGPISFRHRLAINCYYTSLWSALMYIW